MNKLKMNARMVSMQREYMIIIAIHVFIQALNTSPLSTFFIIIKIAIISPITIAVNMMRRMILVPLRL